MDRLNNIEPNIDFTYEQEVNNTLLFFDILQINNNNELKFKVHHKSTGIKMTVYIFIHIV